ncbi:E3 SUMO-protein ligase RanBP2-like [Mercenaria mercenaria]|uniref:E3 SUMO-protein ligase RanBP2-like n=1 Tax=Mercenaria mercenaria TaxID=6596 RepID=UPI00234EC3C2|nr:E3 SUMO-protein ligase RanBP2-like [Mercenaria mercenaria]
MFKTKRDVDRHVSHILNRIREEKERNSRGYQFAKLYYDVADFESGKRYLQAFLSVRETVPQAHKLMGQINEAQKNKNKALESYKRSLDLDPEQKDVILKVCELYSDVNVNVSTDVAKIWIERGEKFFPNHHIVFKLKEKVVGIEGGEDNEELEHLISQELLKNPSDVKLHIKLLRLFIQSREVDRAYEHAITTEKTLAFVSSIDWYECLVDVYQVYQDQQGGGDETTLYVHKLVAMASLTFLRLKSEDRDVVGAVKALHYLDEDLLEANTLRRNSTEWDSFLTEMKGQLFYLMGLLLMKRALKGQVSWKDSNSLAAVCFLISDSLPAIDLKSSWYCQAKQDWKKFYDRVHMSGCDRLSQGGHMIYALQSKQDGQLTRKLHQLCTPQGKTSLYGLVFTGVELAKKKDDSYFYQSDIFTKTQLDTPSRNMLLQYDGVAYSLHSGDLNHIVWLAQQYYSLKDDVQPDYEHLFGYQLFHDMKYSVLDLSGGDPGTICQIDVQVFLCACVRWAVLQNRDRKRNLHTIVDKPALLPACLSPPSCNKQQCEWWTAVNNMERKTASEKMSKLWGVIMRGLETIRLVLPNALSLPLVVHIAKTLDARAHEIESLDAEGIVTPKLSAVQGRAAFYWTAASDMLDRKDRNIGIRKPKELLFPGDDIIDPAVVKDIREQVKFAMAVIAMKQENYKEALSAFENLYKPEASHYTGLIYRKLAEDGDTNQNSSGNNQNSQQIALLSKSKTAMYQALDRLETEQNEELKDSVRRDLDDVVCKLISLESGGGLVDSILSNTSQQYDTAGSGTDSDEEPIKNPSPRTPVLPLPSQSRDRANMSPTKVEVQLRALEMVNSALSSRLSTLEETVKTNANYMHVQMQQLREENKALKDQMQILSLQGLSGMSMIRASGTPQQPSRINPVNMSFGGASMYDFPGQNGLPPHMAQYGYSAASPRPGSAYGQPTYDDGFSHVDGEFYDPDNDNELYGTDQNLIQEWPFGHKAGVEGKSTITYSPQQQQQVRGLNPTSAGMFANALRGPSIQYGAGYPALVQQPPSQLPGPGYFSQNSPQVQPSSMPTQAGMMQGQFGMATKPGTVPAMSSTMQPAISPAMQQKPVPAQVAPSKPAAPMMPPNAVIPSQTSEAKPLLIPGSVGIPAATTSVTGSTKSGTPSNASAATQGQGQVQPGSASSILSSLAAKHQDGTSPVTPNVSTPQKTVFKGFSFTSTPKITEPKVDDKVKDQTPVTTAAPAPKPFSGFSLTPSKPTVASAKSPGSDATQSTAGSQGTGSVFTLGQNKSPSFGSLAAQGPTAAAFQASGDQKGFAGAGMPVFGQTLPRRHNISTGSDDHIDEYEPNVDFKPVIQLPELIEVKTGEEEEEKMFCERAKLFRFDKDAEQWKERGIGDMKILRHRETKTVRILMRREQVLKLCANHKLTESMKLTQMSSSDRAWVWNATDFAEGEMKHEKFAVKFKTVDIADNFKKVFEKCQAGLPTTESEATTDTTAGKTETKTKDSKSAEGKGDLASMFKPKAGSWTCNGCYVNNDGEVLKCPCCGTPKPGVKPEDVKKESGFGGFSGLGSGFGSRGGFKFGSQPTAASNTTKSDSATVKTDTKSEQSKSADGKGDLASMFKPKAGSWTCDGCYVNSDGEVLKCPCCGTLKPGVKPEDVKQESGFGGFGGSGFGVGAQTGGGFKFGSQPSDSSSTAKTESGFKFGTQPADTKPATESGFKFGTPTTTSAVSQPPSGFTFGTPTTVSTQPSNAFGVKPVDSTPTATTSSAGFVFGSSSTSQASTSSIFGTPATTSSIFGTPATTSSIFGTPATTSSIFGKPVTTSSIFGTPVTASSIFGGEPSTAAVSSSLFGGSKDSPATSSTIFGGFGGKQDTSVSSTVFGGNQSSSAGKGFVFGESTTETPDSTTQDIPEDKTEVKEQTTGAGESLLAKFLASPDSWTCSGCYVSNEGIVEKCPCCGTARPENKAPGFSASTLATAVPAVKADDSAAGLKPGTAAADVKQKQDSGSKAGFTFGMPSANTEKKPEGFQFGSPQKTQTEGFKFTFAPTSDDAKPQPAASLGSGFNFSMSMTPIKKQSPTKQTAGASQNVTGVMSPKSPEITEDGFYVNKEGDDSHIHFEPVIELPDHIEVKTGEEEEERIFSHRAKLFRFFNGEWKERGLGDVKVLYHSETNKARIVMRREQILKLCCNHYISPDLNFKTMPNSQGRALVWYAMDFAEGEPKPEQFSIKFKNEEIAKEFESSVKEAQEKISGTKVSKPKEQQDSKSASAVVTVETIGAVGGVPESHTDEAGSDEDVKITSVEEATEEEIRKARELMLPDHFYLYTRKPPCPGCLGCNDELPDFEAIRGVVDQSHGLSQTQEEGEVDDDDEDDDDDDYEDEDDDDDDDDYEDEETNGEEKSTEAGGFLFGGGGSQFSFASLAAGGGVSSFSTDTSKPFQWQGAGRQLFGGGAGADDAGEGGSGDEGDVQQGEEQHFEPVVPLPELIDVKTGEEDETVEFSHRAKLYRFDKDANQWKEKGVGEMKILKHKETGKYRLLLRREQVHKLACNHLLTPDISVTPMNTSETAWCWTAQDYSEGECKVEQLAVKFKTIDLAKEFKQKVDEVQALQQEES